MYNRTGRRREWLQGTALEARDSNGQVTQSCESLLAPAWMDAKRWRILEEEGMEEEKEGIVEEAG